MLKKLGNLLKSDSKRMNKSIRAYNAGQVMNQLEFERTALLNTVIY